MLIKNKLKVKLKNILTLGLIIRVTTMKFYLILFIEILISY